MKNFELHNYRAKPICDMHVHPHVPAPLDESVKIYKEIMSHFNYEKIVLQSLPFYLPTNNFETLYFKSVLGGVYADLGLIHHFDARDTKEYYAEQVKTHYAMGCDGFKLFEGKPEYRKEFDRPLCDPSLDPFYAFCEEKGLPIVMHFGDPREFWDINRVPKWALERDWFWGNGEYTHFDDLQKEVEGILEKFPKLKLILAHFFFVSDDLEYAHNFMQKWENVCFDLTPGTEMFFNFDAKPEEWRAFFLQYADRILFGSDIYNYHREPEHTVEEQYGSAVNLVRSFLERKEPFLGGWMQELISHPFALPDEVLDKIYHDNFIRMFGAQPRPLDGDRIAYEAKKRLAAGDVDEIAKANLQQIIAHFSK